MKMNKCRNKKCQRDLPGDYKHKYCEHCRNKYITKFKGRMTKALGVAGSIALFAISKDKFDFKDK
mgnify:CR=1 FL=1